MQPHRHSLPTPTLRAVLFDLDGTLIATRRLIVECYAQALAPYLGYTPSEHEIMAKPPRAVRAFLADSVAPASLPACLEQFYCAYETIHTTHFEGMYSGIIDMTAKHVNLGPIASWIFDDDVAEVKPHPAGLRLGLERLQLAPQQAIYLGDSLTDVEAAQAAGVLPGAVLWPKRAGEMASFMHDAVARGARIFATPMSVVDFCSRMVTQSHPSRDEAESL